MVPGLLQKPNGALVDRYDDSRLYSGFIPHRLLFSKYLGQIQIKMNFANDIFPSF